MVSDLYIEYLFKYVMNLCAWVPQIFHPNWSTCNKLNTISAPRKLVNYDAKNAGKIFMMQNYWFNDAKLDSELKMFWNRCDEPSNFFRYLTKSRLFKVLDISIFPSWSREDNLKWFGILAISSATFVLTTLKRCWHPFFWGFTDWRSLKVWVNLKNLVWSINS